MPVIYYLRRLTEITMPILFLVGVFLGIPIMWLLAGIVMLVEDVLSMLTGELKPTFPIIAAIIGASVIQPWYLGVFWSIEIFALLGVPTSFLTLFSKEMREKDKQNNELERIKDEILKS